MASVNLAINGGTPPYVISVQKTGDTTERFLSYVGSTLSFNASTEDQTVNYLVKVSDSRGCETTSGFSINCAVSIPDPNFNATLIQPKCKSDGSYEPARLELTNITNATRWKTCYNSVSFDCDVCTATDGVITSSTQTIQLLTPTVPTSRFFIVRLYNGTGCTDYKEFSGTIITTTCNFQCNLSTTIGTPTC